MLLKLCFKCYQVGHNKRSCWIKDPVCVYCPESHLHEDCPKRKGLERPPPRCPFCKGNPPHGPWEDACEHPPIKEARDRMLKAIKAGAPWDPSRHQPDDEPLHELLEKLMETVHEGRRYNTTRNIGVKNAPKRNPTSRPAGSTRTPAATDNKQPTATSPDSDSHNWEDMSEGGELPEETQESAMQLSEMPVPSLVDIASFETYPSFTKRRRDSSQSSYQPSTRGSSPDELSAPPRHSSTSALALVPSAQDVAASGPSRSTATPRGRLSEAQGSAPTEQPPEERRGPGRPPKTQGKTSIEKPPKKKPSVPKTQHDSQSFFKRAITRE